jgi:hypothetical protein
MPKYHNKAIKTSSVYFYNNGQLKKRRFTLATGTISAAMLMTCNPDYNEQ